MILLFRVTIITFFLSAVASASGLKVFGSEFCSAYDAGSCINFHYKDIKDAKGFFGGYKYPKGKAAYDECAKQAGGDSSYAYCSMLFHYAEQDSSTRREMCSRSVRSKYQTIARSQLAVDMYDQVWKCRN